MRILPSLLSADFSRLGEEVDAVAAAGADGLHLDVMDGHFVPNLTFGPPVVKALRGETSLFFDAHLMVTNPLDRLQDWADAGVGALTVHVEVLDDVPAALGAIRAAGMQAGLSLKPGTPAAEIIPHLGLVDLVLVMTVEPGFGGQAFMDDQLGKIRTLRAALDTATAADGQLRHLQVDGGINADTIGQAAAAGAGSFVAGSAVFGAQDYGQAISRLREAVGAV